MLNKLPTLLLLLPIIALASPTPSDELTKSEEQLCESEKCQEQYKKVYKYGLYGSPNAQVLIALAMLQGDGMEQDIERGITWLKKAKRSGSTKAVWLLSLLYREGELVEKDLRRADYLLDLAVNRNYGPALYEKAISLLDLKGNDNQEAIELLNKSRKAGFKQANYLYAKMRETGTVLPQDLYESAQAYRNIGDYRDSQERFDEVVKTAKLNASAEDKLKFSYLEDMEVITVHNTAANLEGYLENFIDLMREDGRYDNRGGMSHILGRVCSNQNGCDMIIGEDLDYFRFGAAAKRYPANN